MPYTFFCKIFEVETNPSGFDLKDRFDFGQNRSRTKPFSVLFRRDEPLSSRYKKFFMPTTY